MMMLSARTVGHKMNANANPGLSVPVLREESQAKNRLTKPTRTTDHNKLTHFIPSSYKVNSLMIALFGNAFQDSPFGGEVSQPTILPCIG
jgi:hypothetical protein